MATINKDNVKVQNNDRYTTTVSEDDMPKRPTSEEGTDGEDIKTLDKSVANFKELVPEDLMQAFGKDLMDSAQSVIEGFETYRDQGIKMTKDDTESYEKAKFVMSLYDDFPELVSKGGDSAADNEEE